ncbi:hypothetical protein [Leisingera sp. ANG59]|uniref:hypothetical protein n=1 Tax=Leisingera sp. ANG59 TaxID=2675221 RepID=UPI00157322B3|nr:hypothetical protein [Leisingera sp. ANG59]NSY41003.1 hypothetical protein [Leisingera sp. ANG59]
MEIDLNSQESINLDVTVDEADEYGLYLLLKKGRPGLAQELIKNGYDLGLPNQTSNEPELLTFTVRMYSIRGGHRELAFQRKRLLPRLLMAFNEWYGLEFASSELSAGDYVMEVMPEGSDHRLENIPSRIIFMKAIRGN